MSSSELVRMDPCPKCGSKVTPALSVWTDGHKWCFSCHYFEPASSIQTYRSHHVSSYPSSNGVSLTNNFDKQQSKEYTLTQIPYDARRPLSMEASKWLNTYGITQAECVTHDIMWSYMKSWLIFPYYSNNKTLVAWQARNFGVPSRQRWITYGKIADLLHIIGDRETSSTIIVVEDVVSAIKVGRQVPCMPLFGSHVSLDMIVRLSRLFERVIFWLDRDKKKEAREAAARCSQYQMDSDTIETDLDPKEYTDHMIKRFLENVKVKVQ